MQLFVDMDGVLADFDRHHETITGYRSSKLLDNADWAAIRARAKGARMPRLMTVRHASVFARSASR